MKTLATLPTGTIPLLRDSSILNIVGVKRINVRTKGKIEIRMVWDETVLGKAAINYANVWRNTLVAVDLPRRGKRAVLHL